MKSKNGRKRKIGTSTIQVGARNSLMDYDTSESKLRREFEIYGPIKKVNFVCLVYFENDFYLHHTNNTAM